MNIDHVRKIILDIIALVAPDADLTKVKDEERLRDQLELDSMDFLDIVMELRKRYKIEVPKEDYLHLASLKSCIEYLLPKFRSVGLAV
ncbi:MAG: Acyl carrier protein [Phycisphaerae bacterium]|nr:Acyl carrier protein [Phycisphaerae bacterium]